MPSQTRYIAAGASLVLALASGQQPRASVADVLPFKATERTLPNGLKVIVVPTGFPNLVSVQIPVQTGSRNEVEPGKSGLRALLRAHDVPRHADDPAREVPRRS